MRSTSKSARLKSDIRALAIGSTLLAVPFANAFAETPLPPVSVGAGVRTSFAHSETAGSTADVDDFALNSARIYLSGKVMDKVSIMFNTEYNGTSIGVIDAVAQFSFSEGFNVWAGRFLAPSDRANLYGPYYASNWGVYTDGIQDGYPGITTGRSDGVMYWGQYGIAKVSFGLFDVPSTLGKSDVVTAGRVQLDFWDPEGGYYLNGTYYGEKDLLAVGIAAQKAAGNTGYNADFLLEKNFKGAGVVTVEAEYAHYDAPRFGYGSPRPATAYTKSDGYYLLGAYLFPMEVGIGKFQVLAKYGQAKFDYVTVTGVDQKTMELNFNYIIKAFNARVSAFYIDTKFSPAGVGIVPDSKQYGLGLQVQM